MNSRRTWMAALVVLCFCSFANPQQTPPPGVSPLTQPGSSLPASRGSRRAAFDDKIEPETATSAPRRYSRAEIMNQAVEISQLGQSLTTDIQQANPDELSRQLKKIEKLAKKLRDAIAP